MFGIDKGQYLRRGRAAPGGASRVGHDLRKAHARNMHLPQHCTHRRTVSPGGGGGGLAVEAADDAGGFVLQYTQKLIMAICHRCRAGNAVTRQMSHQVQVERQFISVQFFEQREDEATIAGGDEIVGVFDAGRNPLQTQQLAQRIIAQPFGQLGLGNGSVNRHINGKFA